MLSVLLFTFRQRARMRELARERDAQRRLVEEMQKVESFRRDFIADVSHEIKTPLTGIIGAVDLLVSPDGLPTESRDRLLSMLRAEAERLNGLAQGILSLARLERDTALGAANFAPADISEIVRDAVRSLRVQAEKKGATVRLIASESCIAVCDGQLISSAVSNLVLNAIRHSGSDEVSVSVSSAGKSVSISVEDHGVGIPPEDRERVFDRFYRVDRSRDSGTGGTGLGLAIVRGIALLHGGSVILESVGPSGCRFVLTIQSHNMV